MKNIRIGFFILLTVLFYSVSFSKDYFISSSGNNKNSGTSKDTPWANIDMVGKHTFQPGDRILLRSGDTFKGTLFVNQSGTEGNPIVISRYGEGENPIIDGDGQESAIFLHNPSFITIENLKITNWKGTYGIRFEAKDAGEMKDFIVQNLEIRDVGEKSFTISEPSKSVGAISGRVFKGNKPSWWNGMVFRNLNITNVGSCGITFGNEVNLYLIDKDNPYYKPHRNVLIEKVKIDSTARDGIWIRQCDGAIIQHCQVSHSGMNAIANGIWFWDCLNSVMQYNEGWECLSVRGNDGAPFSIDNHCINCVIQYNYSHDNEGPGYMIFGRMGDGYGNIVRHNISYNDNVTRTYKSGTAAITISSVVKGALVENNLIVAGRETHNILGHRDWEGFPESVTYRNNIFIGNGFSGISNSDEVLKAGTFLDNLFINVPDLPKVVEEKIDFNKYFEAIEKINKLVITESNSD